MLKKVFMWPRTASVSLMPRMLGMPIASKMPKMATATMSSISVIPDWRWWVCMRANKSAATGIKRSPCAGMAG